MGVESMPGDQYFHITKAGKLTPKENLSDALSSLSEGGFLWLNYCDPEKATLKILMEAFDLHPLVVEDCLDENQIPKIENYPKNTFILFNAFEYTQQSLNISEIDMVIGDNYLITVRGCGSAVQSILEEIEHHLENDVGHALKGPAYLLHVLLDRIVDRKFSAIAAIEDNIDESEDLILTDIDRFNPADLLDVRRNLIILRKSLFHEREVLVKICRKDCPYIPDEAIPYYRDVYDHLAKFFELTLSSRDLVSDLMELHVSMINNRMTKTANITNASLRRLTLITTIFMPLTLLAGIGGMSEWSMMTGPENWKIAYPLFLIAMAAIGGVNYYLLKRIEKRKVEDQ
jgi:magnesium transporter